MIYLTRTDYDAHGNAHTAIAACETPGTLERAEARGFTRCSEAAWHDGWEEKDWMAVVRLAGRLVTAPLERAVGFEKHWVR